MNTTTTTELAVATAPEPETRHPFLLALGERVREQRARRGMTRKAVALAADVSERHLANLEYGMGNASILVLLQVARALQCELSELLAGRGEAELRQAREALGHLFQDPGASRRARGTRIALIGLRGAGKSTLGRRLAEDLGYAFIELSREIEQFAGCGIHEIHNLYGTHAYRRYERRALEEALQIYPEVVIATPGGLVSDAANFNLLLEHCLTIWLQASPTDHMARVAAQGDLRPMAASTEAMEDLKRILAGRSAFYAKADLRLDTSQGSEDEAFARLRRLTREAIGQPV